MPKLRSIKIGALNITLHPHTSDKYVQLFRDAKAIRRSVRFKANHYAMLGTIREMEEGAPELGLCGLLYRHIDFGKDEPWLNLLEEKPADEGDLDNIKIPEHLKPGLTSMRYVFFPEHHRLFFETKNEEQKTLGPTSAQKIFSAILNQHSLVEQYGEVTITIEPSKEGLEKIFAIPKLKRLSLEICRPNADDLEDAEKKVLDRLNKQNAKREDITLIAEKGSSLEPDEDMKTLAQIAASNGKVTGKGKDQNNNTLDESTRDHPWGYTIKYDPDTQDGQSAFLQKAKDLLPAFIGRLRK